MLTISKFVVMVGVGLRPLVAVGFKEFFFV